MIDGWQWRNEAENMRAAWMVSHIVNATGNLKRPITPEKLLGKKQRKNKALEREQELLELEELKKEIKGRVNGKKG